MHSSLVSTHKVSIFVKLAFVYPTLPPALNGIGDHTAHLCAALAAQGANVQVLTAQDERTPIPNVPIKTAFSLQRRRGIMALADAVQRTAPDWLILQYEPFSYGHWGLNPFLPLLVYQIKHAFPALRLAVLFHEDYMPPRSLKNAAMSAYQIPQFWLTGRLADVALFPVEPWAQRYSQWFPRAAVDHQPVGSNIPEVEANPISVRHDVNLPTDAFVVGLFGSGHPSRLLSYVDHALAPICRDRSDVHLLYIGPDGAKVRRALDAAIPLHDAGPLPGPEVSRGLSAMDLYLAPFREGVSARRGSFLAGIQHGIATISTRGPETGPSLQAADGTAFRLPLCDDPDAFAYCVTTLMQDDPQRQQLAAAGRRYYDAHHDWPELARTLRRVLQEADHALTPSA